MPSYRSFSIRHILSVLFISIPWQNRLFYSSTAQIPYVPTCSMGLHSPPYSASLSTLISALTLLASSAIIYLLTLCAYRILLHPLSFYPWPILCKITPLVSAWHAYKDDRHLFLHHLHITGLTSPSMRASGGSCLRRLVKMH